MYVLYPNSPETINELSARLARAMSGTNYGAALRSHKLPPAHNLDDIRGDIRQYVIDEGLYDSIEGGVIDGLDFSSADYKVASTDEVIACLRSVGHSEGASKEVIATYREELIEKVQEYIDKDSVMFLAKTIRGEEIGIYWGYVFVILNSTRDSLLFYAWASD